MVLNSPLVMRVANVSANLCQYIACNPERLSSDQVLDLIFCFPVQELRRFAFSIWTFFCLPPPPPHRRPHPPPPDSFFDLSGSSSSSSSSYYNSHSD